MTEPNPDAIARKIVLALLRSEVSGTQLDPQVKLLLEEWVDAVVNQPRTAPDPPDSLEKRLAAFLNRFNFNITDLLP